MSEQSSAEKKHENGVPSSATEKAPTGQPAIAGPRTSMLDIMMKKFKGKSQFINRIVIVGRLSPRLSSKKDLEAFYDAYFRSRTSEADRATGILLIFSRTFIHLIEANSKVIMGLARKLQASLSKPQEQLAEGFRVIYSTEDIPERAFPIWACREQTANRTEGYESDPEEIEPVVGETVMGLLQLGQQLSMLSDEDLATHLDNLKRYRKMVPSEDRVLSMIESEELCSLEEFLELYDSPPDIVLESDLIFPASHPGPLPL